MLANTLVLEVDVNHDGTATADATEQFTRYEETQNRTVYIGENHTPGERNLITFSRSTPKRAGNFKGVGKSSVKFTQDITVAGVDSTTNVGSAIIIEVNFSVPVGTTRAQLLAIRQRLVAMLDDDSTMDMLSIQLMV
jgi:hypothetical protein